jgi:hypothetical protein
MIRILVFYLLTIHLTLYGQNCNCDSLFLQTQKIVEDNYAGWFDKVTSNNRGSYNEWTVKHLLRSQKLNGDSVCSKLLQEWVGFFGDRHLRIKYNKPKTVSSNRSETKEIQILNGIMDESQINSYFLNTKNLDPIEGIYESSSYKLGITQVKQNLFYATILSTKNDNWKVGEVKLVINKRNDKYDGLFYEGDKSDISTHNVQLVDNILDFDIVFYEKTFPTVAAKRDITEYEMSKDRYAPGLTFINDVAIWKFPSFENNAYEQTEYLMKKYKDKLEITPYWILDMANNSGGDYSIGLQLLEYIYTKPIVFYNGEMRMTENNFDLWYKTYLSNYYENLDSIGRNKQDIRFNKMKASYGKMYIEDGKPTDTLKMENTKPFPHKIALLINKNTLSSGELFTMIARQSDKVIVMGENSGGMMDYGNIVHYKTNCATIRVQLPTNRQLWLDTGFSVDNAGLKPDIYLKGNDWIEQAIRMIKN